MAKINDERLPTTGQPTLVRDDSWIRGFGDYIADVRTLSGLFSKGVFIAPIIAGLILSIGPPWPSGTGVSLLTAVAEVVISIYIFHRATGVEYTQIDRWLSSTLKLLGISLILYLTLFSFFVKDMPDSSHRDVRGIYYTIQASNVIGPAYTEESALRGAGYEPTQIWAPWTVYFMRLFLALVWISFFCSLSAYIALFVLRRRASQQSGVSSRHTP